MGNKFFNHGATGITNEYELFNNAVDEICEIFGIDFYFLPRTLQNSNYILGEDQLSKFEKIYKITLYIENDDAFENDSDLFNKFGFSITQDMTLTIQQRRFHKIIGRAPLESDLLYHLPSKKIFEIKKIKKENSYYQMGGGGLSDSGEMKYIFAVKLFQQSFEEFITGNENIDFIGDKIDSNNNLEKDEINSEQSEKLDFNESDIFGAI